jgi:hypothetical protein
MLALYILIGEMCHVIGLKIGSDHITVVILNQRLIGSANLPPEISHFL